MLANEYIKKLHESKSPAESESILKTAEADMNLTFLEFKTVCNCYQYESK